MAKIGLYPGTFDPVTLGHMNVIEGSSGLFDGLFVAIMENSAKKPIFTVDQRREMLELAIRKKRLRNVSVIVGSGLTADVARKLGDSVIIVRGLRLESDYGYELKIAMLNWRIRRVDTLCWPPIKDYLDVDSSSVRATLAAGQIADAKSYLSPAVFSYITTLFNQKPEQGGG